SFTESFGGNEWLIEEQYEKFLADPEAVGPEWRDFFAKHRPDSTAAASTESKNHATEPAESAPRQAPSAPADEKPATSAAPKSAPIPADVGEDEIGRASCRERVERAEGA